MALNTPNVYWVHPTGDNIPIPCSHRVKTHPDGDEVTTPCTHRPPHLPPWHKQKVECKHFVLQHPKGDPGPVDGPCLHRMTPVRKEDSLGLDLYVEDTELQNQAIAALVKLKGEGVMVGSPRRLSIFHRPPIFGDPNNNLDPFWSHYDPQNHSIQLTQGRPIEKLKETVCHEIGHAVLGHSCVQAPGGGPHSLTEPSMPGVAMSEGWANFVALVVLSRDIAGSSQFYKEMQWESRSSSVPKDPNIEYNVGCTLWDLFDKRQEKDLKDQPGTADDLGFTFRELFKVYSPTLATLANGPINWNLDDYLKRLTKNNPDEAKRIDEVRKRNCG